MSQEAAGRSNLQSGLTIAGGAIGLISLFVGGIPVAFVGLVVGGIALFFAYLYVELVAKAVRMWINRSLFGNHLGQIEPFRSGEEELASLGLVFKGLTVVITWEHVNIRDGFFGEKVVEAVSDPRSASGMMFPPNGKRFKIDVLVPDIIGLSLDIELTTGQGRTLKRLSIYSFVNDHVAGLVRADRVYVLGESNRSEAEIKIEKEGGKFYGVSYYESYLNEEIDVISELSVALGWPGGMRRDNFEMRF